MLHEKQFIEIGQIRRAHGYKGHAKIILNEIYLQDLVDNDFLFIDVNGCMIPFRIEEINEAGDYIVKLQGIDNPESLNRYHQNSLFLLKENLLNYKGEDFELPLISEMVGMEIIDDTLGSIGYIDRIEEYPQQYIAIVNQADEENLIPIHHDLIVRIDQATQKLYMNLPEGLV